MPPGTVVSRGYLAPRAVDGARGTVRATFANSAYVVLENGPALVLHAAGRHDHTPTSLCPATWPPPGSVVAVGDRVVGRAGHLKIGELVLDVRGAREWRPARAPVLTTTPADPGTGHRLALRAAGARTGELLPELERALAGRDVARVTACVASLVGRGPGLTPSGDDALVGLLAVLHRLAPTGGGSQADLPCPGGRPPVSPAGDVAADRLALAIAAHLHRTGDISAHYLRLAADGHFGERPIALCDALAGGAQDELQAAAAAVLATGATSGADALLGVVSGVRVLAATRAREPAVAA